jgi:hypothetical protein
MRAAAAAKNLSAAPKDASRTYRALLQYDREWINANQKSIGGKNRNTPIGHFELRNRLSLFVVLLTLSFEKNRRAG